MEKNDKKTLEEILVNRGLLTADQLTPLLALQARTGKKLGEILVEEGLLTEDEVLKALHSQFGQTKRKGGVKFGEVLLEEGLITKDQLLQVLEKQMGVVSVNIDKVYIEPEAAKMIPEELARKYNVIPIQVLNGEVYIAMKDPLDYFVLDDIKLVIDIPFKPLIALERDITYAIDKMFGKKVAEKAVDDFIKEYSIDKLENVDNIDLDVNSAPIVRFVSSIIENAILNRASDIHIEPGEDDVRIRFRIDGVLHENMRIGMNIHSAVVSRIKIMANMNITEKRAPQDGRTTFKIENKQIDIRISIVPTIYGEKIVMRVLDKTNFILSKDRLGMSKEDLVLYDRLISKPYGIILVTGPTGSGKTTTLYTILSELNKSEKNIVTLEDPVEYNIQGINQIQLNVKAGLTFANGLRSVLRQDPDIIMVGEIRDELTAEIAVKSSLTGHLVLSTLHTNDAVTSITRLLDMNVDPFLISSSLLGVIAQRLVRRICPYCKHEYVPTERELKIIGIQKSDIKVFKGKGCDLCAHSGYKGRIGLFEIMEITREHRELIDSLASSDKLRDLSIEKGMSTLTESCRNLVLNGDTTVEEMFRITFIN